MAPGARLGGADLATDWAGWPGIEGQWLGDRVDGGGLRGKGQGSEGRGQRACFEGGLGGRVLDGQLCLLLPYHVGLALRLGIGLGCEGCRAGCAWAAAVLSECRWRCSEPHGSGDDGSWGRWSSVSTSAWAFS